MKAKSLTYFQSLPPQSVDLEAGVIRGVSVLSLGPAAGHGIEIDREGLKECYEACKARGSVKLIDRHDAEFEGIVGAVTNFSIEGDRVKGDVELFENHPMRARILEIAQKIPTEFGLSIECDNDHIENPNGKGKLFRTSNVDAVALVPRPAANRRGLFSAKQFDTPTKTNSTKFPMSKLKTALKNLFSKFTKLEEGDDLDTVIDAVVEAIQEKDGEANSKVEERLKKLEEGATDDGKEKLEEGDEKEKADKEKESEEKMAKLAEKAALDAVTKFSKELGIKRAPGGAGGFEVTDEKTKLEAAIKVQMDAGAKNRAVAISRLAKDKPEIYNTAREKGLL